MSRYDVQTVTLPVLVDAGIRERKEDSVGSGTFLTPGQLIKGKMWVRVVTDRDIKTRLRTIFRPEDLPLFIGAIELKQAYESRDEFALHRASEKVRPWMKHFVSLEDRMCIATLQRYVAKWGATQWNYSGLITDMLRNARLVIWFSDKDSRFLPAVYCADWKTAAFVMTFMGRIRVCPKCSILFVPSANNVNYCTPAHREAHRVERFRWRAQQKKGGKA